MSADYGYWHEVDNRDRMIPFQTVDVRCYRRRLVLLASIEFTDRTNQTWTVPLWFRFPFATPIAMAPLAVYGWLCTEPYSCSSVTAARIYWECLRANGVRAFAAWRRWAVARWFGPRFKPGFKPEVSDEAD